MHIVVMYYVYVTPQSLCIVLHRTPALHIHYCDMPQTCFEHVPHISISAFHIHATVGPVIYKRMPDSFTSLEHYILFILICKY